MKLKERKAIEKELDDLWSKIIRSVGECQKCGSKNGIQAAHIVSRKYKAFRWDLRNGICLCTRCHLFWSHKNPVEFSEWLRLNYPDKYRFVLTKNQISGKVDIEKKLEELRSNSASGVNIGDYQSEIQKNMLKIRKLNDR